jgi:hypothetical protein
VGVRVDAAAAAAAAAAAVDASAFAVPTTEGTSGEGFGIEAVLDVIFRDNTPQSESQPNDSMW